jgi:hypothetical protein
MLLEDPAEKLPWELPLLDVARNHVRGKDLPSTLGDSFYFQPGHHSYIARKIEIAPSAPPSAKPAKFHQGDDEFSPRAELLSLCCSFVQQIMLALAPSEKQIPEYRVSVQRLKYQAEWQDFEALTDLVEDSLARWGRLGCAVDSRRASVPKSWAGKGTSDLLALAMTIAGKGQAQRGPQGRGFGSRLDRPLAERIYEHAHTDYRFFTGLCGNRANVRTEVLVAGRWHELPVDLRGIAIYPGTMALEGAPFKPTIHRVVYAETADMRTDRASNVTVLLGAV